MFDAELNDWYTDPALWPQSRDFEMFVAWFDVEFHSGVFDLCDDLIEIVDYGAEDDREPNSKR